MPAFIDIQGQQFNEWTALEYKGHGIWKCRCICGTIREVPGKNLRNGKSKSCGHDTNRRKELTGKMFGLWKVIGFVETDGKWLCECQCENHTTQLMRSQILTSGKATNCGCIRSKKLAERNSGNREHLEGKTFEEWTVLNYVGNNHYRCICSCGKIKDVASKNLKNGISKSCGHNNGKSKIDDLTGQRFGKLTVSKYLGQKRYLCQCECGNISIVLRHNLLSNTTKSCGCGKITQITEEKIRQRCKQYELDFGEKPFLDELANEFEIHPGHMRRLLNKFDYSDLLNIEYSSKPEKEICDILRILGVNYIMHNRSVLNRYELDIYIPSRSIAIEFNGSYWHSDVFKESKYHQNKTIECAKKHIKLIHIFEYEWSDEVKKEKIVEYIKRLLSNDSKIIYARKTEIKQIDSETALEFINKYHLQGYTASSINIGCFYNNELAGLMTFGKPRFNNNYQYELIRLCYDNNVNIVGGMEKMFSYFKYNYNPQSIITYCDISKFTGNSYTKIDFHPIQPKPITEPNYVWVELGSNTIMSRYQTQKQRLLDLGLGTEDQTEDEIMKSHNFYKIYDSGNLKLEWKKEK